MFCMWGSWFTLVMNWTGKMLIIIIIDVVQMIVQLLQAPVSVSLWDSTGSLLSEIQTPLPPISMFCNLLSRCDRKWSFSLMNCFQSVGNLLWTSVLPVFCIKVLAREADGTLNEQMWDFSSFWISGFGWNTFYLVLFRRGLFFSCDASQKYKKNGMPCNKDRLVLRLKCFYE